MRDKLTWLVADVLAVEPESVNETLAPGTSENWDSLNHLRLISAVEEEFAVSFTMREIESIRGFAALRALVDSKRGAA